MVYIFFISVYNKFSLTDPSDGVCGGFPTPLMLDVDSCFSFVLVVLLLLLLSNLSLDMRESAVPSSDAEKLLPTPSSAISPSSVHRYSQMLVKKPVPHNASLRSLTAIAACGRTAKTPTAMNMGGAAAETIQFRREISNGHGDAIGCVCCTRPTTACSHENETITLIDERSWCIVACRLIYVVEVFFSTKPKK
jgi:hypothetical protein